MRKWKCIPKKWKKWSWITCHNEQGLVEYRRNSSYRPVHLKIRLQWSQVIKLTCSCIRIAIVGKPLNKSRSLMAHFKSLTHLAHRMDQFSKPLMSMFRKCLVRWPNQGSMALLLLQPRVKNRRNKSCQTWSRAYESSMRMWWDRISLTFIPNTLRIAAITSIISVAIICPIVMMSTMATNLSPTIAISTSAITKPQAPTKTQRKKQFQSLMEKRTLAIWARKVKRNTLPKLRSRKCLTHCWRTNSTWWLW